MANSASSAPTNSKSSSRFSTLKVFKFASKDKGQKPPPPPPKDTYYLPNRSFASLVPESVPNSPLYAHPDYRYAQSTATGINSNHSAISLVSSVASAKSSQPSDNSPRPTIRKEKSMNFFKFGRRSPKSPANRTPTSSVDDPQPPSQPPQPDEGISMPWNFQHNIHVDEGYTGLPPSWMTSLLEAGFSEEEIANIQARRVAGTLAPNSYSSDRPQSPALSPRIPYAHIPSANLTSPVIVRPSRTSSLPRQYSDASLRPSSPPDRSPPPPVPILSPGAYQTNRSLPRAPMQPARTYSYDQESLSNRSTSSLSGESHQYIGGQNYEMTNETRRGTFGSIVTEATPPRSTVFRVANGSAHSPPPTYSNSMQNGSGYAPDQKARPAGATANPGVAPRLNPAGHNERLSLDEIMAHSNPQLTSTSTGHYPQRSIDKGPGLSASSRAPPQTEAPEPEPGSESVKRTAALPPRLSLHKSRDSTDLESWTASLFSAIPSGLRTVEESLTSASTFAAAQVKATQSLANSASTSTSIASNSRTTSSAVSSSAAHPEPSVTSYKALPPRSTANPSSIYSPQKRADSPLATFKGTRTTSGPDSSSKVSIPSTAKQPPVIPIIRVPVETPPGDSTSSPVKKHAAKVISLPSLRMVPPILVEGGALHSDDDDDEGGEGEGVFTGTSPTEWSEQNIATARFARNDPSTPSVSSSRWDAPGTATSPLWTELEGILRAERDSHIYTAALSESFSPTLPDTPSNGDYSDERRDTIIAPPRATHGNREEYDEPNDYLSAGDYMSRSNRDSNRSSSSTLTITGYTAPTIVRNVSFARKAGAFVINQQTPAPGASKLGQQSTIAPSPTLSYRGPPSPLSTYSPHSPSTPVTALLSGSHSPSSPVGLPYVSVGGGSEEGGMGNNGESSSSGSSSSHSQAYHFSGRDYQTPSTEADADSPINHYLMPSPDPSKSNFAPSLRSAGGQSPSSPSFPTTGGSSQPTTPDVYGSIISDYTQSTKERPKYQAEADKDEEGSDDGQYAYVPPKRGSALPNIPPAAPPPRPKIVISDAPRSPSYNINTSTPRLNSALSSASPASPMQRYPGWLSEIVAPLAEFIDEPIDPKDYYIDFQEVAEGDSGSVNRARLAKRNIDRLRLPPLVKAKDIDDMVSGRDTLVAIKCVAISPLPTESPTEENENDPDFTCQRKLTDLKKELTILKGLWHEHVLGIDAMYVDLTEDSLWIRMELMHRSLTDVLMYVKDGPLVLAERVMARFVYDVLLALDYLQQHNIAHRDIRSDNLLINPEGMLKLADFSSAVQVPAQNPNRTDVVGVPYWQAPEIRTGTYDALKVDVWSLGATLWEMTEAEPPFEATQKFTSRWPPLSQPEIYTNAFKEFLHLCSEPAASRPAPAVLLKHALVGNACGRSVINQLLQQCVSIETQMLAQQQ